VLKWPLPCKSAITIECVIINKTLEKMDHPEKLTT